MSTDLGRLAAVVKSRRLALYKSRDAAATAAGVARGTWKRVEEGLEVRDGSYAKIDAALKWPDGSCVTILGAETAMTIKGADGTPDTVITVLAPEAMDEEVRDVVQLASIATTGLAADEIRALANRVVQDLKKRGVI